MALQQDQERERDRVLERERMGGLGLKVLAVLLLLVVFLVGIGSEPCRVRRGKHWRASKPSYFASIARKKAKWKSWVYHHAGPPKKPKPPSPSRVPAPAPSTPPHSPSPAPYLSPTPAPSKPPYSSWAPRLAPAPHSSPTPSYSKAPHSSPAPSMPPHSSKKSSHSSLKPPHSSPAPCPSPPQRPVPAPRLPPAPAPAPTSRYGKENVFDVMSFGAIGDGVRDDTKAFMGAWAAACKVEGSTVYVPPEYVFLVGPISFSGPYCQPNILFQLDGTIVAPTNAKAWGTGLLQWLEFTKLKGITIKGKGLIDGRGAVWWTQSESEYDPFAGSLFGTMPHIKPTALRFYGSEGVKVSGISIVNSPQCHLKFDNCAGVEVYNMSISSPETSLNTDGIHLQNSRDVSIHHTSLSCGDDCVSIQTGCANVVIQSVMCGPGHGISIGGLGRDATKACVSNVTVQNVALQGTMTGVRIKTWQGGSGSVRNVKFSGIRMSEVQTPIVIDQFYCDKMSCHNQTTAVALSSISYENIKGTYTVKPVHLACSDALPCWDIRLNNIELRPQPERFKIEFSPFCWQTFGQLLSPSVPPIGCLQNGKPVTSRTMADPDTC